MLLVTLNVVIMVAHQLTASATTSALFLKTVAMITQISAKTQHVILFYILRDILSEDHVIFCFSAPEYDLVVANGNSILFVHYEGESFETLRVNESQTVQGIDFHYK